MLKYNHRLKLVKLGVSLDVWKSKSRFLLFRASTSVRLSFSIYFTPTTHLFCTKKKKLLFLFYTPIFTKHSHQFSILHIYSIKYSFFYIFFIILSLIDPLSHRPNTQRKVAVVFVDIWFWRTSDRNGFNSWISLLMLLLALKIQVLQAFFVVNFLYFLFGW